MSPAQGLTAKVRGLNVFEAALTGWLEIKGHKMRSFLSFFAISIGVASILYTSAQVSGMNKRMTEALELVGPGRMEVEPKRDYQSRGISPGLTSDDAEAIRSAMPELHMVYPVINKHGVRMRYREFNNDDIAVFGVTPEWRRRDWVYTQRGRFLQEADVRQGSRVAVVIQPGGWFEKPFWARWFQETPFDKLLQKRDLLGQVVSLNDRLFTVVGVIKEPPRDKDPRWFRSFWTRGGTFLVPISTFQRTLSSGGDRDPRVVNDIQVDTGDEETIPLYKRRIERLLEARHREPDFEVNDNREQIQGIINSMKERAIAILAVGIVAILAGGIGIMNVTLATIFSRVKEIGVRRAVGATRGDIMAQFVVEAMVLGLLGGIAGLFLGLLAVEYLQPKQARDMAQLTAWHCLGALLLSVGTGFVFALYPASQAAKLDPVEALHYE